MRAAFFTHAKRPYVIVALSALAVALTIEYASRLEAQATVTISGVAANHSSVKVLYAPVPGARDYRIYDVTNPRNVKYAGLVHLTASATCPGQYCGHHFVTSDGVTPVYPYRVATGASGGPQVLDVPALQIDYNGVGDGNPHTLIVEAVDALGPVPQGSLYTGEYNRPAMSPMPAGSMTGANKGPTDDGNLSTNGQGPYTNAPQVIARSQPFVVQADRSYQAIPSKATATQTFFDTFENAQAATIQMVARDDRTLDAYNNIGMMRWLINNGTPKAWNIEYRQADNNNSMPFISSDHFMDMLFDGGTEGSGAPGHENIASMSMSPMPATPISITGGRILHLTMEVDAHMSMRKWMAFSLSPSADPLQAWHPDGPVPTNANNQAIFLELRDGECTLDIYTGSGANRAPIGTAGGQYGSRIWGGNQPNCNIWDTYVARNFSNNGLGFDDKSRYDFFISETRVALFQDGQLLVQTPIPAGSFGWVNQPLRAYFTHYVYHTVNDLTELMTQNHNGKWSCYPMNAYWFNNPFTGTTTSQTACNTAYPAGYGFRFSDERHWDNMGMEVLAATDAPANDWSSLAALVALPTVRAPGSSGSMPAAPSNVRVLPN